MTNSSSKATVARAAGPTVCVVIPTYNSRVVISDAIDSVLAQTYPAAEIIIVDDGSTDDTGRVVQRYGDRVRYIHQPNSGPAVARNAGAALAHGEWLAFLDADDLWLPEKLAGQLAAAASGQADAVLCAAIERCGRRESRISYEGPTSRDVLVPALLRGNALAAGASSVLVRRSVFSALGGFDPALTGSEDRDFFIRLTDRFRLSYLRRTLVQRRTGPVQFGGDAERNRRNGEQIIRKHAFRLASLPGSRLLIRQARARVSERAGMHYLLHGQLGRAGRDLAHAVLLWPFLPNPWKAFFNVCTGRRRYGGRPAVRSPDTQTVPVGGPAA